jgi:hypothetical protein
LSGAAALAGTVKTNPSQGSLADLFSDAWVELDSQAVSAGSCELPPDARVVGRRYAVARVINRNGRYAVF